MGLINWNRQSVLPACLTRTGAIRHQPLVLFDVGASGGIDRHWASFGEDLRVWGFEPLVAEAQRLSALALPHHTYEAAYVGFPPYRERFSAEDWWGPGSRHDQSFGRYSGWWVIQNLDLNPTRDVNNHGAEVVFADRVISIDEYCLEHNIESIDYLKIDTDGSDYEVLLGAERMLTAGGIMAVQVEAQFHGAVHREANLFSNIDLYLREKGFSLFDLDIWRYSRDALPRPFVYNLPAQTQRGQVSWGEALYFRDVGDPEHESKWPEMAPGRSPEKLLKQAALFDLFSLQDCAVELLLKYAPVLDGLGTVSTAGMIADLIPPVDGRRVSHAEFLQHFETLVRQKRYRDIPM